MQSVGLFVRMSVRKHISGTALPIFTQFCVQIPCGVARSSLGGVVIRYVLPVLWMTSRLAAVGRMAMRERLAAVSYTHLTLPTNREV